MWLGVKVIPSTPTDTRVVCPVGVTDEVVAAVPVPVPCVVGAVGLDRKIARASATTETTPMIAPAVRLTGEWSPAGLMRSLGTPVAPPFDSDAFGTDVFGTDVFGFLPPDGDADRFRSATAASLRGGGGLGGALGTRLGHATAGHKDDVDDVGGQQDHPRGNGKALGGDAAK